MLSFSIIPDHDSVTVFLSLHLTAKVLFEETSKNERRRCQDSSYHPHKLDFFVVNSGLQSFQAMMMGLFQRNEMVKERRGGDYQD